MLNKAFIHVNLLNCTIFFIFPLGNCAIVKPSELAPQTASLVENLIAEYLDKAGDILILFLYNVYHFSIDAFTLMLTAILTGLLYCHARCCRRNDGPAQVPIWPYLLHRRDCCWENCNERSCKQSVESYPWTWREKVHEWWIQCPPPL